MGTSFGQTVCIIQTCRARIVALEGPAGVNALTTRARKCGRRHFDPEMFGTYPFRIAIVLDNSASMGSSSLASWTTGAFTVGSGANRILILALLLPDFLEGIGSRAPGPFHAVIVVNDGNSSCPNHATHRRCAKCGRYPLIVHMPIAHVGYYRPACCPACNREAADEEPAGRSE